MKRFFLAAESKSNRHRGACRGTCTRHRHKRRAQHGSQPPYTTRAIQHVYDCTVREIPHFPIYSTPPCTQGLSPNRKMRFPARFFRVGSWNFDTWFAFEFQACPKLSILGKMLWHFLQKSNPRIYIYRDSSRKKNISKRLCFGHAWNTHADHVSKFQLPTRKNRAGNRFPPFWEFLGWPSLYKIFDHMASLADAASFSKNCSTPIRSSYRVERWSWSKQVESHLIQSA